MCGLELALEILIAQELYEQAAIVRDEIRRRYTKPHTLDLHCDCNPRKEVAAKSQLIVIHDAFDGRVVLERVEELLK